VRESAADFESRVTVSLEKSTPHSLKNYQSVLSFTFAITAFDCSFQGCQERAIFFCLVFLFSQIWANSLFATVFQIHPHFVDESLLQPLIVRRIELPLLPNFQS
jgi:hypothetical protein